MISLPKRLCAVLLALAVVYSVENPHSLVAEEPQRSAIFVEMAFGAELAGQDALRDALIQRVLSLDPDHAIARGLVGQVRCGSEWTTPATVEHDRLNDPLLQEYSHLRETGGDDARSMLLLANWCRDHHMPDRERVHLNQLVFRHGPDPAVMSRLGMIKFRGVWIPKDKLTEFRQFDDRRRRVERKWRPVFAQWKDDLKEDDPATYERLAGRLATLTDFEALPILEDILSTHSEKAALAVVARLDAMSVQDATESLVRHAVFSEYEAVRLAAAEMLKSRPMYNYIPLLLAGLVAPREVAIELPYGSTDYVRRTTILHGPDSTMKLVEHQTHCAIPVRLSRFLSTSTKTPRLTTDAKPEHYTENGTKRTKNNQRILEVLHVVTDNTYEHPAEWWDWWDNYNEYEREAKPTYERHRYQHSWKYVHVPPPPPIYTPIVFSFDPLAHLWEDTPRFIRVVHKGTPGRLQTCLAPGTPVVTETGSRPVEQILPGDKVLSQDAETGELEYKVVLDRTIRPRSEMRKVSLGDDSVTTTLGHPFWVAGKGWRMAKELEVGQRVRCLGTSCEVTAVEVPPDDVAYNLIVDDFATYFAGDSRVLLHDNTLPKPTDAILPGFVAKTP